jgi:serine/threonine protein phosphatase PrpC
MRSSASATVPAVPWTASGKSDPGRVRENNEDRFYIDPEMTFFFVIDGMGGHQAGETAAAIACSTLKQRLERKSGSLAERIREAITLANNDIFRHAAADPDCSGMACVLTVAAVENDSVTVGHVGDSRLYLLTNHGIEKVTCDHSPVGILEDSCKISEIEAMRHPNRNEVFRDVGSAEHSPNDPDFIDIYGFEMPPDSALLLCSDGLTDLLTSHEILSLYRQYKKDLRYFVEELIAAANDAGGHDNITVVAATNGARGLNFHETQEIVRPKDITKATTERMIVSAEQKPHILNRIFLSPAAFMIYGSLLTVLVYLAWLRASAFASSD